MLHALAIRHAHFHAVTTMSQPPAPSPERSQRRVLAIVLLLNVALAVSLALMGIRSDSSSLIANAVDNASDAAVYVLSLIAVGRSPRWKRTAAILSASLLILFGLGVLADVINRLVTGSEPIGRTMMIMAVIAALINVICMRLLARLEHQDVNLRAAETFSLNDFVSNGGVLVAGILVAWTGWTWPDLVVGIAVVVIAGVGAVQIARDVRRTGSAAEAPAPTTTP